MTTSVSASAVTATGATFNFSGQGSGFIDVQIGTRWNFEACLANTLMGFDATQNSQAVTGLNQSTEYFIRARTRNDDTGLVELWGPTAGFRTLKAADRDQSVPLMTMTPAMLVIPSPILTIASAVDSGQDGERNGFPAINLTYDDPVACQVGASNGNIYLLFSTNASPIDTVALLCTNFPEDYSWSIQGGSTSAVASSTSPGWKSPTVPFRASANIPGRHLGWHGLMRLASPQAFPWWQINLSKGSSAPPFGMALMQHLVVGLNRASKTASTGLTEQGANLGSIERTRSGIANRQDGYRIRNVDFDLSYITERQYQDLYRDLHYRTNDPMLIVPNPIAGPYLHDRIAYGSLNAGRSQLMSSIHQTKTLSIDSLI